MRPILIFKCAKSDSLRTKNLSTYVTIFHHKWVERQSDFGDISWAIQNVHAQWIGKRPHSHAYGHASIHTRSIIHSSLFIGESNGGARDVPPHVQFFLIFMPFSTKFLPNNRFWPQTVWLAPPSRRFINPVADSGFPQGGDANPPGRQHRILPNSPKNCMKFGRGARVQNFTM